MNSVTDTGVRQGRGRSIPAAPRIPVLALGMSLGVFFAVTFALCVALGLAFPQVAMFRAWTALLPGFAWLDWPSVLLGLAESFAYGWYVALIFAPLFNFLSARWAGRPSPGYPTQS